MAPHLRMRQQPVHHRLVGRFAGRIEQLGAAGYRQLGTAQALDEHARLKGLAGVVLAHQLRRPVTQHQALGKALLLGQRQARDHEMAEAIARDQPPHQVQKFVFRADGSRIDFGNHVRRLSLAQQGWFIRFLHL